MMCLHGQGVEPVQTFCGQGGGSIFFRDFVQTSFMDGSLHEYFYYSSATYFSCKNLCLSQIAAILLNQCLSFPQILDCSLSVAQM